MCANILAYWKCFDEERYIQTFIKENSGGENEYKQNISSMASELLYRYVGIGVIRR